MWEVLLSLNIGVSLNDNIHPQILAWYAAEAFDSEPFYEYSVSRRNGVTYIEPLALPTHKNSGNVTYRVEHLNTSDHDTLRRQYHEQRRFGQPSQYKRVRRAGQISEVLNPDKALSLLQGSAKREELNECVHKQAIMVDCNYCVCMGGQLYICTSRICAKKDEPYVLRSQQEYLRNGALQRHAEECIEGEVIRSFDRCNRCYCGGGRVYCTTMGCEAAPGMKHKKCYPGEYIPSPDDCNSCNCNARGEVVCTVKSCGPRLSTTIKAKVCIPNTWYSMTDNTRCKECYCVNGKISFCYMKLCVDENKSQRVMLKNAIQSVPGILPDKCRKLDYVQDKCTKCYCNEALTWICRTKDLEHCIGKVPNPWDDSESDSKENLLATKKPKRPRKPKKTKKLIRPKKINKPKLPKKPTTRKPIRHTTTRKPIKTTKYSTPIKTTKSSTRVEPSTSNSHWEIEVAPEFNYNAPEEASQEPHYPIDMDVPPPDYEKPPRINQDLYIVSDDPPYIQPEIPNDSQPQQPGGFLTPDAFDNSVMIEPTIPTIPPTPIGKGTLITNVDRGPFCLTGQYMSQSSNNTCQSCLCTSMNEWKCWSVKGPCQNYPEKSCTPGRLKKNSQSPCSVCYCGADGTSYCATDEACAFYLKPSNCEAVACMDQCVGSKANLGICHLDKCVCIP